jgi:hypothetical protein
MGLDHFVPYLGVPTLAARSSRKSYQDAYPTYSALFSLPPPIYGGCEIKKTQQKISELRGTMTNNKTLILYSNDENPAINQTTIQGIISTPRATFLFEKILSREPERP